MKFLRKVVKILNYLLQYFDTFGIYGLVFLAKRYFFKHKVITFSFHKYKYPIFLRNCTTDIPTFAQVILNQDYDVDYLCEPKVIIDCGANIGLATVYFKNRYPNVKIISIEPEQSNFQILLKNTEKYENVYCLNNGIWNKSTNLIIKDIGWGNWGFMVEEVDYSNDETIKAISIVEIMKLYNIDYIDILKIDIEGSEKELFESNFEEWLPKVKVIVIEVHDNMRKGATMSVLRTLTKYDFSFSFNGENIICFQDI